MALVRRAPPEAPAAPEAEPATSELAGRWTATLEHAGQHSSMTLEIVPAAGEADFTGRLSLPAIDLKRLQVGALAIEGDAVSLGPLRMTWDAPGQVLSGVLPASLVPVFSVAFALRRATAADLAVERAPPHPDAALAAPVWIRRMGAPVWAGLALAGDRLLVGSDDGAVVALSALDGSPHWRFETGGRIRARPTIVAETALVSSDDGQLYALATADGSERWRVRLGPASTRKLLGEPGSRYEHFASAPAVSGNRIFVANASGELLALELESGAAVWRFKADDSISSTPAVAGGRVNWAASITTSTRSTPRPATWCGAATPVNPCPDRLSSPAPWCWSGAVPTSYWRSTGTREPRRGAATTGSRGSRHPRPSGTAWFTSAFPTLSC